MCVMGRVPRVTFTLIRHTCCCNDVGRKEKEEEEEEEEEEVLGRGRQRQKDNDVRIYK